MVIGLIVIIFRSSILEVAIVEGDGLVVGRFLLKAGRSLWIVAIIRDGELRLMGGSSRWVVLRTLLWQPWGDLRVALLRLVGLSAIDRSPRCQ